MSDISVRRSHGSTLEEAKSKIEKVVSDVEKEFPSLVNSIDWNGDKTNAKVKGKGFTGEFKVDAKDVAIDVDLSFFAKPFKAKVEEKIVSRMQEYFG
ncbi:MAG: polyhydroxyalkanoic acid system family protein [Bradymonadaceae bacterium]|nr:polyhydroxyalkanoic acid system family protein [Lujinxingiaceae bacterium]